MSGIPPQLDASPGTPPREWASKTTSALSSSSPPAASMNPTTQDMLNQKNTSQGTTATDSPHTQRADPSTLPAASTSPKTQEASSQSNLSSGMTATESPHIQSTDAFPPAESTSPTAQKVPSQSPGVAATNSPHTQLADASLPAASTSPAAREVPSQSPGMTATDSPHNQPAEPTSQQPVLDQKHAAGSTISTPGREVPGAYPTPHERDIQGSSGLTDTASKAARSVTSTVAQYTSAAAQYLPSSVVNTVSPYIPGVSNSEGEVTASNHDRPHRRSLPSTELTGAGEHEHTGGVGALPGPITESGVTELPTLREQGESYPTVAGAAATAKEKVQDTAQGIHKRAQDIAPNVLGESDKQTSLPTSEAERAGQQPFSHSGGVGSLPGRVTEPGVALLPDQDSRGATNATSTSVGTHGRTFDPVSLPSQEEDKSSKSISGGAGSLPGGPGEEGVAVLPDQRHDDTKDLGKWEHDDKSQSRSGIQDQGPDKKQGVAVLPDQRNEDTKGLGKWERDDKSQSKSGVPDKGEGVATLPDQRHESTKGLGEREYDDKSQGKSGVQIQDPVKGHEAGKPGGRLQDKQDVGREEGVKPVSEQRSEEPLTGAKNADSTLGSGTTEPGEHHGEKSKKVGFMAKMKGEAKILLGKVEGKVEGKKGQEKAHDKVEEGQKIKAGEATS